MVCQHRCLCNTPCLDKFLLSTSVLHTQASFHLIFYNSLSEEAARMILKTNLVVRFPTPFPLASQALWWPALCLLSAIPSGSLPVSLSLGALQPQWPSLASLDMPSCPCLWAFEFTVHTLPGSLCPIFTQLAPDLPFWAPLKCHSSEFLPSPPHDMSPLYNNHFILIFCIALNSCPVVCLFLPATT